MSCVGFRIFGTHRKCVTIVQREKIVHAPKSNEKMDKRCSGLDKDQIKDNNNCTGSSYLSIIDLPIYRGKGKNGKGYVGVCEK